MSEETIEQFEKRLESLSPLPAPQNLRAVVLGDVHRELRAAWWDRRLARGAAALLVLGVVMNVAIDWQPHRAARRNVALHPRSESLAQVAAVVAETTDAQTGRQFARHVAVLAGWPLGGDEMAAIEAAVARQTRHTRQDGKDG
jgi:hypothetical protein